MYKVPKRIRDKMRTALTHYQRGSEQMDVINAYFEGLGFDGEQLRSGDGTSLEEIEYGNDIIDAFCENIEDIVNSTNDPRPTARKRNKPIR